MDTGIGVRAPDSSIGRARLAGETSADRLNRQVEASLGKETGAEVLYEADPARLVERLGQRYRSEAYVCPCRPDSRPSGAR